MSGFAPRRILSSILYLPIQGGLHINTSGFDFRQGQLWQKRLSDGKSAIIRSSAR
jgi:hypothetical protein